jgi:type I restriction enzyme S subunit
VNDELPEGWSTTTVGELVGMLQYGTSSASDSDERTGVPLLRMGNIQAGRLDISHLKYIKRTPEIEKLMLAKGDVLFNRTNSPELVGKTAVFDVDGDYSFASYLIRMRVRRDLVIPEYLCWWINSPAGRNWAASVRINGVSQANINGTKLSELSLPLAPLAEQRRIVAKVEALLARVNAARERLEKVPLLLKRFRQSVLAKAFRGELVPTEAELAAREGRPFESAAQLLGKSADDVSDELPEGWASTAVEQLLQPGGLFDGPFGSSLKTADYTDSGVRVIRLENIANLHFVAEKETWVTKTKFDELKRHSVGEGDIIFGSFVDETVRVCILPKLPTPAIAKADCFCVRPKDEVVDRKFLVYQLGSLSSRNALVEQIHGATRPRINTGQLRALVVNLPPIAEQRRIVTKVEALLALADSLEQAVERTVTALARAPQAILERAFAGELVSTEAELARAEGREFERAEELLRRARTTPTAEPSVELEETAPKRRGRPRSTLPRAG